MKPDKADITQVARAARVSPSTVSRAFNHPDLVKPSTRKRIDAAVRRLGYIRNRAAQTIHGIRSGTIGLVVPTVDHAIFAELIESFARAVEDRGFTILLASHGYDLHREYALTRKMLEHRVDGIALIGTEHISDTFDLLAQQGTPTVLLWNHDQRARFASIGADNAAAGRLIADHILDLGHREIATLFPPLQGNDRAAGRLQGVQAALAARGLVTPAHWQLETPYSVTDAKAAVTDQLLSGARRPTALICGNDVLAWGALHAFNRMGIRVPQQISVTGIGDFKGSREFEPALTTVRIPARQIGAEAARTIASAITNPEKAPLGALIPPEPILRATTAPPLHLAPNLPRG